MAQRPMNSKQLALLKRIQDAYPSWEHVMQREIHTLRALKRRGLVIIVPVKIARNWWRYDATLARAPIAHKE